MKYELLEQTDIYSGEITGEILRRFNDDGSISCIPKDPANSDYQRYLRWLENPDAEKNGTISQEYGETLQSWATAQRDDR